MTRKEDQLTAIELRLKGLSIKEISLLLKCAKSSVSYWVRNVKITKEQQHNLRERMRQTGELNGNWKGGYVPSAPYRRKLEQLLNRKLLPDEIVHHINGNHSDNRIENLQVMTQSEHSILHNSNGVKFIWLQCAFCNKSFTRKKTKQEWLLRTYPHKKDYCCRKCHHNGMRITGLEPVSP